MTRADAIAILVSVLIVTMGPQALVACADLHKPPMSCPDWVWDRGEDR